LIKESYPLKNIEILLPFETISKTSACALLFKKQELEIVPLFVKVIAEPAFALLLVKLQLVTALFPLIAPPS